MIQLVLVIGMGSITWHHYQRHHAADTARLHATVPPRASLIEGLTFEEWDNHGQLSKRLQAPQAFRPLNSSSTLHFKHPQCEIYRKHQQERWSITAQTADLDPSQQQLHFHHQVTVINYGASPMPLSQLTTDAIDYDLRTKIASTPDPIAFQRSNMQLTAKGMHLDLARGELAFTNRIRGHYDAPTS